MNIKSSWTQSMTKPGVLFAVGLFSAWHAVGCGGEAMGDGEASVHGDDLDAPEGAQASALRRRFPDRAALVLDQGEGFVATEAGFAPEKSNAQGAWQGVDVALPRDGREAIHLRGFGGVEVRVWELGVQGEGEQAERAVAYPRTGGTSFWTASLGGVEEWLHLEASAVRAGEAIAAWEVEGATVRQSGEGVEVVDAGGVARLSVTAPIAYAVGGREIGAWLVGSGTRIELRVDANEEAVLVDPLWIALPSMSVTRTWHAAALLGSGDVLVAGGIGQGGGAELYDPATNAWLSAGSMSQGRYYHTATRLGTGNALVVGGVLTTASQDTLATAELYSWSTNTWSPAGSMSQTRDRHTATLLGGGKVLIAGGIGDLGIMASTELYEPATNTWLSGSSMSTNRYAHTATLLASGKVLVAGGYSGLYLTSAEVYDPTTNTWSPAGSMAQARYDHTATLLANGKVLVTGGYIGYALTSAELYDPATNAWSPAGSMNQGRNAHTATPLASGKVLVAGGDNGSTAMASVELYDPATNTWSPGLSMGQARTFYTATRLESGEVLVAGGFNGSLLASAELYGLGSPGDACLLGADCGTGFCVDGVCCGSACDAGPCDACSITTGGAVNGTCALLTGPACTDGNVCTQGDACQAGACVGANAVFCPAPDQCHAGVCDPATGMCSSSESANGTACDDGDGCTQGDACQAGACVGAGPVVCPAPDQCHAGVCDPATGMCAGLANPNGTACDDGDGCTQTDTCQAGVCAGGQAVVCAVLDTCHVAGQCDAATGVCTNPAKPDTAACDDGDACTQSDTCLSGACVGGAPLLCDELDECHAAGVCDAATGVCTNPSKPDGAACANGTCNAGACVPAPDGSGGGGTTGGSGATGGSDGSGDTDASGGCGCVVSGSPAAGGLWVGLGLLLAIRRRRMCAPTGARRS